MEAKVKFFREDFDPQDVIDSVFNGKVDPKDFPFIIENACRRIQDLEQLHSSALFLATQVLSNADSRVVNQPRSKKKDLFNWKIREFLAMAKSFAGCPGGFSCDR